MIHIEGVHKRFGQLPILRGVTLTVERGQTAVIIGASGGGKSTLLRCINALEKFDEGHIKVGDLTLRPGLSNGEDHNLHLQLRRRVGMVFQQFNLFPHYSALENVMAGPIHALGLSHDEAAARARALLERVGLKDKLDARPATLSGGQQQRVAIARALANEPAAILFDEPTSALDPRMTAEVLSVMTDLSRAGQTMIVVSHAMGFARRTAHVVHVMVDGQVIESGPPGKVFDSPQHASTRELLAEAES
jgi:polar amino acid transport system ATP-binding protein